MLIRWKFAIDNKPLIFEQLWRQECHHQISGIRSHYHSNVIQYQNLSFSDRDFHLHFLTRIANSRHSESYWSQIWLCKEFKNLTICSKWENMTIMNVKRKKGTSYCPEIHLSKKRIWKKAHHWAAAAGFFGWAGKPPAILKHVKFYQKLFSSQYKCFEISSLWLMALDHRLEHDKSQVKAKLFYKT